MDKETDGIMILSGLKISEFEKKKKILFYLYVGQTGVKAQYSWAQQCKFYLMYAKSFQNLRWSLNHNYYGYYKWTICVKQILDDTMESQ